MQGISAGPNNVWPYRRCHPNDETYKASPICIQSTWGTPGGPQLSVRWSTTKWLTDLRQNQTFKSGQLCREFRQGQATFGPTEDVTQMMRHAKHLLFKMGNPRWSTTHYQVVHNKVADRPQAKSNIQVMAISQGISAGPSNVWPYRRCHPNDETCKASPIQDGEPQVVHNSLSGGPQQSG